MKQMYPLRKPGINQDPTSLLPSPEFWIGGGNARRKARNENLTVPSRGVNYVPTE